MKILWLLLGKAIRLGSLAATVYLLWNGRWRVIFTAIGFSLVTPVVTALVNVPMGVFFRELGYPEALTAPGLTALVNPVRLLIVSRLPQLVYGGLAYGIGLTAYLLFGSGSDAIERAVLMITAYETGFAAPTVIAHTLAVQEFRGTVLSSQLFYGKIAFLTLLVVHSIRPLAFWPAAALLAVAMVVLECAFEIAAWRRGMADIFSTIPPSTS